MTIGTCWVSSAMIERNSDVQDKDQDNKVIAEGRVGLRRLGVKTSRSAEVECERSGR